MKKFPPKQSFEVRLQIEEFELRDKLEKLSSFVTSPNFENIESEQRRLLIDQMKYMIQYRKVLIKRMELLNIEML